MSIDKTSEERKAEIIEKIKTGRELSEEEAKELVLTSELGGMFKDNVVDKVEKNIGGLTRSVTTILEIDNELYAADWEEGLSKFEYNSFLNATRPYKVKKVEKVITVVEYEPIES